MGDFDGRDLEEVSLAEREIESSANWEFRNGE
jgi:hypothetical protein